MKITRLLSMFALLMVVAILFHAPCSCEPFIDEPALQKGDVKAAYLGIKETEMKDEKDGYEDNGEGYDTFPDELVPLWSENLQAEPSSRDKEVYSDDFEDDDYEDYNGELPKDSKWALSDIAKGEPAEGEDSAEVKFNGAVDGDEETYDWNLAGNSERVGDDVGKDRADEEGESKGEDEIKANDPQNKPRPRRPQRRTRLVQCSRGRWYNPATQICCGGRINYRSGARVRCCGRFDYDETRYICCSGRLHRRIGLRSACCGTFAYSRIFHLCCRGTVQPKFGQYPKCCGRRIYDAFQDRCCGYLIRPRNVGCSLNI